MSNLHVSFEFLWPVQGIFLYCMRWRFWTVCPHLSFRSLAICNPVLNAMECCFPTHHLKYCDGMCNARGLCFHCVPADESLARGTSHQSTRSRPFTGPEREQDCQVDPDDPNQFMSDSSEPEEDFTPLRGKPVSFVSSKRCPRGVCNCSGR